MLRVDYNDRIGYFTNTEKCGEIQNTYKIWLCRANCDLWASMYFYKVSEDYEEHGKTYKKGEKMAQLHGFAIDTKHLKNCLKNGVYDNCDNYHFIKDKMTPEIWQAVRLLAEYGKTITIKPTKK